VNGIAEAPSKATLQSIENDGDGELPSADGDSPIVFLLYQHVRVLSNVLGKIV
jgi:hypothetical protein